MSNRLHIVRHAEGVHNVGHNKNILDPELTAKGISQSQNLSRSFPYKEEVGLVITSPLRRTLQTTYEGFREVLDQKYFAAQGSGSSGGISNGARLLLDADVQAHSDRPCDTGSDISVLQAEFPETSFADLPADWHVKVGPYAGDRESVNRRAEKVRQRLIEQFKELEGREGGLRRDIVIVSHGGMIGHLIENHKFRGVDEAGWKTFFVTQDDDGKVKLNEL